MREILKHPVVVSLGVAFAVRAIVSVWFQNVFAPDEVYQFLEQAHRLVYGQGEVPWEFEVGLRSWLIPGALAVPMYLAHALTPSPLAGLVLIRLLMCAASLTIVWCAAKWGERFHGLKGAWVAGLFAALWPDLWVFAPHPLEEVLAADVLVPAIYLVEACRNNSETKHIAWAGFLLGLGFVLREQLAPAIAVAGLFLCGRDWRRWRIALPVAALPVLCVGLLDWLTWGQPFRSFWLNIYLNLFLGVAKAFGSNPPSFYLTYVLLDWLWAFPFVAYLAWRGAARLPVAGLAALAVIVTHCAVAHKEFRFLFPAVALIIPLAGCGLAALCGAWKRIWRGIAVAGILAGAWVSPMSGMMLHWQTASFRLFHDLSLNHPCIVSLQGWDKEFLPIPPLFGNGTRFSGLTVNGGAEADVIVASKDAVASGKAEIPAGFTLQSCVPGNWVPFNPATSAVCVWRRPVSVCPQGAVAPFIIAFPDAAKPFIVRRETSLLQEGTVAAAGSQ